MTNRWQNVIFSTKDRSHRKNRKYINISLLLASDEPSVSVQDALNAHCGCDFGEWFITLAVQGLTMKTLVYLQVYLQVYQNGCF